MIYSLTLALFLALFAPAKSSHDFCIPGDHAAFGIRGNVTCEPNDPTEAPNPSQPELWYI